MQETSETAKRIVITLLLGLFVFVVAYIAAWRGMGTSPYVASYRMAMHSTLQRVVASIETYREDTGKLPATLSELAALDGTNLKVDQDGNVIDHWKNPVTYTQTDEGFIVCSLGRDGASGGRGMDNDLCMDNTRKFVNNNWQNCGPTFWQFAFNLNTKGMLGACIASALLAMGMYYTESKNQHDRGVRETVLSNLIVTLIFSLLVAAPLVFLHAPQGH